MYRGIKGMTLSDLKCAEPAEVREWFVILRRMWDMGGCDSGSDPLATFCNDARPSWCRERAAEGRCIRVKRDPGLGAVLRDPVRGRLHRHVLRDGSVGSVP